MAQGELYIIDVSQSVELDHPLALDFLREDIAHINAFFRRAGVATLTMRELFDFVVDPSINDDNIEAALEQLRTLAGRCAAQIHKAVHTAPGPHSSPTPNPGHAPKLLRLSNHASVHGIFSYLPSNAC